MSRLSVLSLEERITFLEDALAALGVREELARFGRLHRMLDFAAAATGLTVCDLMSDRRGYRIAHARWAVMWTARKVTPLSLPQIGEALGGMDHTSVMHGLARAGELREGDEIFKRLTDAMVAHFEAAPIAKLSAPSQETATCPR